MGSMGGKRRRWIGLRGGRAGVGFGRAAGPGLGAGGAGTAFGSGWVNDGGSGEEPVMAAQIASARGLRSWRGGVLGGGVELASKAGGVDGTFGERLGVAGGGLEVGSRAVRSGGVGGREAGSGSRMTRARGRDEDVGWRAGITVELPEL